MTASNTIFVIPYKLNNWPFLADIPQPFVTFRILQLRLTRRTGKRAFQMLELNKFRAGFDMLEMRGQIEEGQTEELACWWQEFQDAPSVHRQNMVQAPVTPNQQENVENAHTINVKQLSQGLRMITAYIAIGSNYSIQLNKQITPLKRLFNIQIYI